jgi:hypothetical protein
MRRSTVLGLVAILVAATIGVLATVTGSQPASAQTFSQTFVVSDLQVTPVNGFANFGSGEAAGVIGASCTGARPLSGSNIPAQVVTDLQPTTIRLRVLRNTGTVISGVAVFVNCAIEVENPTAAARIKQMVGR